MHSFLQEQCTKTQNHASATSDALRAAAMHRPWRDLQCKRVLCRGILQRKSCEFGSKNQKFAGKAFEETQDI